MSSPSPVRFAVIGAGAIGYDHLRGIAGHPDGKIAAIVDNSKERGQAAAAQFGNVTVVDDYKKVLADDAIDAVTVALPNYLHAQVAIDALDAGKHVLIDKPMTTHGDDAQKIIDAAAKAGKTIMVGQNQRFSPAAQTVKRLIADGAIGRPYRARAYWLRRSGIPRIGSWFTQKEYAGGGCLYDIGVHALDLALHLLGEFAITSVSGQIYREFGPRGQGGGGWGLSEIDPDATFDVDDSATALIRLDSGATVNLEVSWAQHQESNDRNGVEIYGTEGTLFTNPLRLYRGSGEGWTSVELNQAEPLVNPHRLGHFIDVLLGRAESFVPPAESLAVQRALDAVYASAAQGISIQPPR